MLTISAKRFILLKYSILEVWEGSEYVNCLDHLKLVRIVPGELVPEGKMLTIYCDAYQNKNLRAEWKVYAECLKYTILKLSACFRLVKAFQHKTITNLKNISVRVYLVNALSHIVMKLNLFVCIITFCKNPWKIFHSIHLFFLLFGLDIYKHAWRQVVCIFVNCSSKFLVKL